MWRTQPYSQMDLWPKCHCGEFKTLLSEAPGFYTCEDCDKKAEPTTYDKDPKNIADQLDRHVWRAAHAGPRK